MPIFQYKCPDCGKVFDELVKDCQAEAFCPDCHKKAERVWGGKMYSSTGKPAKKCSGNCSRCGGCK